MSGEDSPVEVKEDLNPEEAQNSTPENKTSGGAFSMLFFNMSMAIILPILIGLVVRYLGKLDTFMKFYVKKPAWVMISLFFGMFITGYYISMKAVSDNQMCSDSPKCSFVHLNHGLAHGLIGLVIYQLVLMGTFQKYKQFEVDYEKVDYILKGKKIEMDKESCNPVMENVMNALSKLTSPFGSSVYAGKDDCGVYEKKCSSGLFSSFFLGDSELGIQTETHKNLNVVPDPKNPELFYYKCPTELTIERGSVLFFFLVLAFYLIIFPMPIIVLIYFNAVKMCS
tara:strand:+ start:689 stop:1534 length:846 start_codon:yes stop_codon:yes gene_type:complete